jgi:ABC-2 type transport system permease protein
VMGNIDRLRNIIRLGTLDAAMVRPLGVLGQLLASEFAARRIGRVVQGVTVYGIALAAAHVRPTAAHAVMVVLAPLCGLVFFSAWFLAGATISFWWIDSGEFASGFTYGGRDFVAYPVTVYSGLFRRVFGYGLGFAFIAYYPGLVLLDRPDPLGLPGWTGWGTPAVAAVAAGVAALLWRIGVRQYRSSGS